MGGDRLCQRMCVGHADSCARPGLRTEEVRRITDQYHPGSPPLWATKQLRLVVEDLVHGTYPADRIGRFGKQPFPRRDQRVATGSERGLTSHWIG